MREVTGDLFAGGYKAIGHGINCKGVMGAGIAKQFRERFPEQYKVYRYMCLNDELGGGDVHVWREHGVYGFNIASQYLPGPNATYTYLARGLDEAAQIAQETGLDSIAIPRIGCGIGGMTYENLVTAVEYAESRHPGFEFVIVTPK